MVRYAFLVRLSHPLLHAGLSRRLLDHLICPRQHVWRYGQADLLSRLQVDHQLKLRPLLDWKIGGLSALENFVDKGRRAAKQVPNARAVKHEATSVHIVALRVYRGETTLGR